MPGASSAACRLHWLTKACAACATRIMALAALDAGPYVIGGTRLMTFFGGQDDNPQPLAKCNGKELYMKKCPKLPGKRRYSPGPYLEIKPYLAGALLDKRFENDELVCNNEAWCPQNLFSKMENPNPCEKQVAEEDGP